MFVLLIKGFSKDDLDIMWVPFLSEQTSVFDTSTSFDMKWWFLKQSHALGLGNHFFPLS